MELSLRLNRKIITVLMLFAFIILIYGKSKAEGTAVPHGDYQPGAELCKQCHKTHEAPVPKWQHLDKKYLLTEEDEKKVCYTCHNGTASPYNLISDFGDNQDGTSSKASRHKVPEGQMVCSDCHTSHMKPENWDATHDYNEVVRLLRVKNSDFWYYVISPQNSAWVDYAGQKKLDNSNRFCSGCHGEDSLLSGGNIVDNYIGTPHDTGLFDPSSGTQIKCMNCHNVHGADYPKLTIAKEENLCYLCHSSTTSSVNNINIWERFTVSSDLKAHHNITDADQLLSGARVECVNCHNSHFDNKTNTFSDPDNLSSLFTDTITNPKIYPNVVLQPDGNNGQDATVLAQYPNTNYGSDTIIWVGLNGDNARSLLKFDLSIIPSGSTVTEAKLYLPQSSGGTGANSLIVETHRLEGSWDENSVTWNNQPSYDSSIAASASLGIVGSPTWVGFTVTQLVSDWLDGTYSNYGIILIAPDAESGVVDWYREFNSSENLIVSDLGGVLAARPKLIVKYTNPDPPKAVDSIGFCNKCHDGNPPAGVTIPFGFRVIASDYLNSSTGDYHGARAGTGYGGDVIGPYSRGMDAMLCTDCHDPHGSNNIYHLKESVNGKSGISVTNSSGSDAKAFCDACHTYYDSPPSNGCFDCHYHGSGDF